MSSTLTCVAIAECSETSPANHEYTARNDGILSAIVVRNVRGDKKGHNGPDVEHVDQYTELVVVVDVQPEILLPATDLLRGVHEHPIVARRRGGDHEHQRHGIQLAQVRFPVPCHPFEPWGLRPSHLHLRLRSPCADL